ncbi:hypothetical protein IFM89_014795, partial [Coptis chinensis]
MTYASSTGLDLSLSSTVDLSFASNVVLDQVDLILLMLVQGWVMNCLVYDRAAIKFRGVESDINFNLTDYEDDMKQMRNLTEEEFVHIQRRHNTGFARGSSKYKGVTLHKCGNWEAHHMGQFLGKKLIWRAQMDTIQSQKSLCVMHPHYSFVDNIFSYPSSFISLLSQLPIVDWYNNLFEEEFLVKPILDGIEINSVGAEAAAWLERDFEEDEVKVALKSLVAEKSFRPDWVEWGLVRNGVVGLKHGAEFEVIEAPLEGEMLVRQSPLFLRTSSIRHYNMPLDHLTLPTRLVREDSGQYTRGYMAPEYLSHSQLTEKVDVYSYGVLLIEIVTRRQNNMSKTSDYSDILVTEYSVCTISVCVWCCVLGGACCWVLLLPLAPAVAMDLLVLATAAGWSVSGCCCWVPACSLAAAAAMDLLGACWWWWWCLWCPWCLVLLQEGLSIKKPL